MSWSVNAIGRAPAVAAKLEKDFTGMKGNCQEPEETIKNKAADIIATALAGQKPETIVKVNAYGSQSTSYDGSKYSPVSNALNITVEPQYGFLE